MSLKARLLSWGLGKTFKCKFLWEIESRKVKEFAQMMVKEDMRCRGENDSGV